MTSRLYRVDTHTVAVEVSLGSQTSLRGAMFLRPSIVSMTGVESIADRLNDRDGFFPLRIGGEDGQTEVIGKTQVRYVAADDQPLPDEIMVGMGTEATEFKLTLELDTGEELSGVFHAVLPKGKRRPLDFVNAPHAGPYVPFYAGRRVYVINRPFIRRVREVGTR